MNDGYTKVKNPTASLDLRQEIPILKKIEATMIHIINSIIIFISLYSLI